MMSPLVSWPVLASLNHLLAQETWAREQLQGHAGKLAALATEVMEVRLQVTPDGMLQAAAPDAEPDVLIRCKIADLPLMMQNRERAFSWVKLEGDADFAHTISHLGQNLRWEAEHDLQQWVGDIAANRMVSGAKAALDAAKSGQQKLAENLAEYFLEENPMLIRQAMVDQFGSDVGKIRDDVERLTKRIDKLAQKIQQGRA
ncbi:MAG: hypothetical protein RL748_4019 [Pseudomonadota bacterium]